jgi:hypothetical protein
MVDMLNARREMKYIESNVEANFNVNGTINTLTQNIIQGDTAGTRDGNSINVKEIDVRFEAFMNSSASIDFIRLIIFSDEQANGIYPTVSGSTNGILTSDDPNAAYDFPTAIYHRFKIWLDHSWSMSINGDSRAVQLVRKVKMGNHKIFYPAATSIEAANGKGALYALLISDTPTNLTAHNLGVAIKYFDS